MKIFDDAFQRKLIYVFKIDGLKSHEGLLKIGDTTIKNVPPTKKNLEDAAHKRIDEYTRNAGIEYKILHTELAVTDDGRIFRDYDVHRLLKKYRKKFKGSTGREWFKVDLNKAIEAIKIVKHGRRKIIPEKFSDDDFRPEQLDAINITVKYFKKNKDFLWNAKMRFGKTLCALQVTKLLNFKKTIIITHRPVVNVGWYEDFNKIFRDKPNFIYGTKETPIEDLLASGKNFVYFISIQDLRGSEIVGGNFDKNEKIFETAWDFVIVDEAHEGTTTALGDTVIKNIVKDNSKFLALSGTPFNILDDFSEDNVYTWDYIMEQRAKEAWDKNNLSEPNPYADLPKMNIFTYDLGKIFNYVEDNVFSFREFFRTDGKNFVHEAQIKNFLDLMTTAENYPFARADYRELFKHTLWIIPGVKEGKALSKILKSHKVFKDFKIVNVAGNGDSDDEPLDALEKVRDAIDNHDKTITLSCGKLTAGVTVPEWTAVFMLAGSYSTSAANYLQTIFRVQSPCVIGDKVKQNCFVFDFAPDRTLKMIAASVAISARAGKTQELDRQNLQALLKFCPVISLEGSRMEFTADNLLQELKHVYIERAVRNGFADNCLYNDELLKLDELALDDFDNLKKIIGSSDAQKISGDIVVNNQGLTGETRKKISKQERSPEQKELDRRRRQRTNAIKILRGISIRMPLLIYGADVPFDKNISIEEFADLIDDASWAEFMPNGVTKDFFGNFIKYYDKDIFIAAGKKIRLLAKDADQLPPNERVKKIAELFATFKNPDKETVLTPWRVVNLHIDSAFDEKFFSPDTDKKILDINAKTGLYPLRLAQKFYRTRLKDFDEKDFTLDALQRFWDKIVAEKIFVICKTPMAQKITRRTLLGFRQGNVNAKFFDDLINTLKTKPDIFINQILTENFWGKGCDKMFFDAVVGNPPYQTSVAGDNKNFAAPVYNLFLEAAFKISDKVSLIHPARCLFNAGATPQDFRNKILNNPHVKVVRYEPDGKKLFPTSDIKGGVAITYYDAKENFGAIGTFIPFEELKSIHQKVCVDNKNFRPLSEIMYSRTAYSLTQKAHEDFPDAIKNFSKGNQYQMSSNVFDLMPEIFFDDKPNDGYEYIQLYGRKNNSRIFKWVRRDYVTYHESLEKFKVFIPDSNGSGALGEVVSTPLVGSPLVGSTQTFITVGAFDTESEAQACIAYIRSKFCRVMLGILKVTQHNPPATWSKVPLQDFTSASDIDWSGQVDEQLYRKYNLSAEEIKFIEEKVKAM